MLARRAEFELAPPAWPQAVQMPRRGKRNRWPGTEAIAETRSSPPHTPPAFLRYSYVMKSGIDPALHRRTVTPANLLNAFALTY
jgi:hypothetical protein